MEGSQFQPAPYKVLLMNGRVFLRFMQSKAPAFGPFDKVADGSYEYAEPDRGVHALYRAGGTWIYSCSYVAMRAQRVDASELEQVEAAER